MASVTGRIEVRDASPRSSRPRFLVFEPDTNNGWRRLLKACWDDQAKAHRLTVKVILEVIE